MKKLFTTPKYKKKHKRRLVALIVRKQNSKIKLYQKKTTKVNTFRQNSKQIERPQLYAPVDFRLIENTSDCLDFFRDVRSSTDCNYKKGGKKIVRICLKNVRKIDYATISALRAIIGELQWKNVHCNGDFPLDEDCKNLMIESGFFNQMYDEYGKPFPKQEKSDTIFFKKGEGKLSEEDNKKLSSAIKKSVLHLTGEEKQCLPIKSLLLEICANSIEHANAVNKQWLLGVKYEKNRALFSVTDVGKGILDTLYKKFRQKFLDTISIKSDLDVLRGAFDKKYGSATKEINRNKGLPSIKDGYEKGVLVNLIVITNNVTLHFGDSILSKQHEKGRARFKGTFYQWELTKESINKVSTSYD